MPLPIRLYIATLFAGLAIAAYGQLAQHDSGVVLRDAVVDPASSAIYASAGDTNEVLKIDLHTGNIVGRAPVGKSPGPIALDRSTLACVSRSEKTVILLRLNDLTVLGEAPIGDGADEITALPGGGFAIVNSFSDSVTLIDPQHPDTPLAIENIASVPSGIAASANYLAVTTRAPAAVLIFAGGSRTPSTTIPVPDGPSRICALAGDRFVVMTKSSIAIVDAASARIAASLNANARDIVTSGDNVFMLSATSVEEFDATLKPVSTIPFGGEARSIIATSGGFVLLSPKAPAWWICSAIPNGAKSALSESPVDEAPVQAAPVETPSKPQSTQTPTAEVPAGPAAITATTPVGSAAVDAKAAAEPAQAPAELPPSPADPPAPGPAPENAVAQLVPEGTASAPVKLADNSSATPEPPQDTQPSTATDTQSVSTAAAETEERSDQAEPSTKSEKTKKSASSKYKSKSKPWPDRTSRIRPGGAVPQPEMNAPLKSRSERPAASPIDSGTANGPSIGQAVTQSLSAPPAEGGFTPPTSADEFINPRADRIEQRPDGSLVADGNVRFTLLGVPDVQFAADHVEYDANTGRLFVSGNVEIVQGPSTAFADEIETTIYSGSPKLRIPPPLVGAGETEDDLTRKLMSIGDLEAKNIDVIEPSRRLRAERLVYDFQAQTGYMYNMEGQIGQIRFGGDELQMEGENKGAGKNLWLTTCDCDHEYYRIRVKELNMDRTGAMIGKGAQLEIGDSQTPLYWPRWSYSGGPTPTAGFDFESGKRAELGYYLNIGQQFAVSPDFQLGYRLLPTTKEGIGFGFDGYYDYMETPASPFFRSSGEFHALYTTNDRGYYEWYHRQELTPNTVLLANIEQWGDENFYKDFYYDLYKDRTAPRDFVNVTYTQPAYIATATVRKDTHNFVNDTERLPEATFHLLEREVLPNVYFSFDTVDGYNRRESAGDEAFRSINVARLTTDIEIGDAVNVTPFIEMEASYYSKTRERENNETGSDGRLSALVGATAQTRFQKTYPGAWGFSGFKHIVVPSVTYSYRTEPTMGVEETPRFDAYDNVYGRSRIESKIDNIVMGKDAKTGQTWQVARLSLYQGNDFWNEIRGSTDYEIELDLRPRSWWGIETIGEHHSIDKEGDIDLDEPYIVQRSLIELYEKISDRRFNPETSAKYNTRYGDYNRILTFMYYDNREFGGNLNGRIGFAYTETQDEVFNREVLYGLGYKINDKWSIAFEHRYDLERGELYRQKYEVRRVMNCLEGALLINERGSGWDFGVELSVTGIPGTKIRF